MRINGFKQLSAFYSWVFDNQGELDIKQSHISLYCFLFNQNNRSNWSEWFKCPFDLGMMGSCIGSKTTYYKCLDDLQKWKLIKYKKGINDYKAPQISIIQLSKNEPLTVPLSEPLTVQLSVPLTGNIIKLITNNYELIEQRLEYWIESETNKPKQPNNKIPTLEEFFAYALDKKPTVNHEEVRLKYFSWVENDWSINRKEGKQPINNWKTTLLNTLKYLGEQPKQQSTQSSLLPDMDYIKQQIELNK